MANLALVTLLFRLPRAALALIVLVGAWRFAPAVFAHGDGNLGAVWEQVGICLARTAMSFSLGVLLGRMRPGKPHQAQPGGWGGLVLLVAIAAMLMAQPFGVPAAWYDLACSFAAAPLLVWLGARFEPPRGLAPFAWFLGEMSYALYAVHWAVIQPLRWFKDDLGWNPVLMAAVYLGACVALAWVAVRYVDLPMRGWFSARRRAAGPLEIRTLAP